MIITIGWYFLPGLVYTGLLENYTLRNFDGIIGQPWSWKERLYHIIFWPISLLIFIIALLQNMFK